MFLRMFIFLIAAAAAGGAAWMTMQTGETRTETVVEFQEAPTKEVLVAAADIPSGEILSADKVRWEEWPDSNLNDQFVVRDARPDAVGELSGSFTNGAFVAGEPIRENRLMATNMNLLSNKISAGMRAAAVKVTAENTAGGFILPGDRVDVIHTTSIADTEGLPTRNESRIIISNARVLAIDQTAVQSPAGSVLGKTATLELTPAQAEQIMAAEASGMLSLALRSVSDHVTEDAVPKDEFHTVRIHRADQTSTITLR